MYEREGRKYNDTYIWDKIYMGLHFNTHISYVLSNPWYHTKVL